MNYNNWFYQQHKYSTGSRNNGKTTTFNDTKWVDINNRYKTLLKMNSQLLSDQPYGVIGNNTGFDKLIDLMTRSNYTFDDIDDSLIETYNVSLKNSMSRMLVNTHAVMFRCNNTDEHCVSADKFTHYYIIDAPFNQLHFGDRDEFIRQKLHKMHNIENGQYIPITEFITSEITKLLGFTILCTVNGFICNDCKVAIDDKGFKFKIGWLYSTDVEFIIYKLDETMVYPCEIDSSYITNGKPIPYSAFGNIRKEMDVIGKKCLINIYDKNFIKTVPSVPNFGTFTNEGFVIKNLQNKTIQNINNNKSKTVSVVIYSFNYLHEVPNVYPAVNYYDIVDSRKVFTENHDNVKNVNGEQILSSSTNNINELEVCTPPIVLDRPVNLSFGIILSCLDLYDNLMKFDTTFKNIGKALQTDLTNSRFISEVKNPINDMYDKLQSYYQDYLKGSILTSLIPYSSIDKFNSLLDGLNKMRNTDVAHCQQYTIDEYYGDNYKYFVQSITAPFRNNVLSNFMDLSKLSNNYFVNDNYTTFNRPVSEQCFITLCYNRIEGCWLFKLPKIEHFKGIGNSFYIDEDLKGNEIFKFFVLYTETESPASKEVPSLDMDTVFDFDMFCKEVDKHIGYIRYWYAENKLLKISKVMYDKYDGETCVQVLSKILKRKIDAKDLIDVYPSDINYETSNITSDNAGAGEYDDRGPFTINFLFYTLSMLNGNEDKLQTYFFRQLTDKKYNNRYADINIDDMLTDERLYPINYSQFMLAPNLIDIQSSVLPTDLSTDSICTFYGLPLLCKPNGTVTLTNPYRCVFNLYDNETDYHLITDNDMDINHYIHYSDSSQYGYEVYTYHDDVHMCKLMTFYLNYLYDYISSLQTNYAKSYNQSSVIESGIDTINTMIQKINDYKSKEDVSFIHPDTMSIIDSVITNNPFISYVNEISSLIDSINYCNHANRKISFVEFINSILSTLKQVYVTTGFDNYSLPRVRMLYINLKKVNTLMNVYQYKEWLMNIDIELLKNLDSVLANNENFDLGNDIFNQFYVTLKSYIDSVLPVVDSLDLKYKNMNESLYDSHIVPIIQYCEDIIKNYIFDMFILDEIEYDNTIEYSTKPNVISITLSRDSHLYPPTTSLVGEVTMIFKPQVEQVGDVYHINSILKICEYAFFNDEPIQCTMNILDEVGSVISSTDDCTLSFYKISSSADITNTFKQISNIKNTLIDIQNVHESYDVNSDGMIVNKKHADMNYEMLIGNHFTQLDHTPELALQPRGELQGPIDRVYVPNKVINDFINYDFGNHVSKRMFFKPSQVFHIPVNPDDNSITSVGGKYFVGQHLYVTTDDGLTIFPIVVTAIDHAINKGFIEAEVDVMKSKWFCINDEDTITKYLTSNIECTVIDDNIRNFLDEYNNSSYYTFSNASLPDDYLSTDTLPGDPIFVQNNSPYVYTRLNYFFNELIPNRFIDDEHKKYQFFYAGGGFINNQDDTICIKMINHDFNTLTNPEMYPILRDEPNDHDVWDKEIETFSNYKVQSEEIENQLKEKLIPLQESLISTETEAEYENIMIQILDIESKIQYQKEFQNRMDRCIKQLEPPTTWYNVRAYEDTLVYISNGRAKISPSFITNIRDIPYNDKLDVFIYDWEHKCWVSPSSYTVSINMVDSVKIDEYDDYTTNKVLHSITITPAADFQPSKKLLIYFGYNKSDIFDDIQMNDMKCLVRFKPILSLDNINKPIDDFNPYHDIQIRKHFNGNETFIFDDFNPPNDFSNTNSFHIIRPRRSGKYTYSPVIRWCDMKVYNGDNTLDFNNFDLYVRIPFKDISTPRMYRVPMYNVTINQPIDSFVPDQIVKLIVIQNTDQSLYDGNISSVMFEALTSYTGENNDVQTLAITASTLPSYVEGSFVCTVFRDDMYKTCGGLITINITSKEEYLIDPKQNWIRIPDELSQYREIPDECIIVPKSEMVINQQVKVVFSNSYIKDIDDEINIDNTSLLNPYEYYFNTSNKTRLPISNIHRSSHTERLVVDKVSNPDIKLIKSTYIGVCRYSLQQIPDDGFIDVTGFIPTPLSRDRYEFWVNGRCIKNKDDIVILSPTSFQLCNLKSLRNFELIELVDDTHDSSILQKGNLYVDLNGQTYSSFKLAMLSNQNITKQDIRYMFNANQHQSIHDYTSNIIGNPNNHNIETDILDDVVIPETETNDYNQLHNVPSINGVSIFHPRTSSFGIMDIPNDDIINLFDNVWKYESLTNPLFDMTHRNSVSLIDDQLIELHVKQSDEGFIAYAYGTASKYFTLYLSKKSDGKIDDIENTIKIIPFIKTGVYVSIDKSYRGLWLHSTMEHYKPIIIR